MICNNDIDLLKNSVVDKVLFIVNDQVHTNENLYITAIINMQSSYEVLRILLI